jgi:circadian clock protein KaiB
MTKKKAHDTTAAFIAALAAAPSGAAYQLRLFVTGNTPRSARAIQNIRAICDENLKGRYELEVIDIYQHPEHIQLEQIVVTPTLVKKFPLPFRKMIGDLSDKAKVMAGLDIFRRPFELEAVEDSHGA